MLELWAPELNGLVGLPVEWSTSNTHASESVRHVGSLEDPKLVCEGKGMRPPKMTMLLLPCGAAVCAQRAPGDSCVASKGGGEEVGGWKGGGGMSPMPVVALLPR